MVRPEIKSMDVSKIPDLLRIAEEVQSSGQTRVLERDGEELAILKPAKRASVASRARRKTGIITKDDPLWNIVGMADRPGDPVSDVSENKHKYLAEAYADTHE